MNKTKFFDRYQFIITIVGLSSLVASIITFVIMLFTATITHGESGEIDTITYHPVLVVIYSSFLIIHILAVVWFVARLITFKQREKEEELL